MNIWGISAKRNYKKESNETARENKNKNSNNRITEMKTDFNELISRLDTTKGKISELEDRPLC